MPVILFCRSNSEVIIVRLVVDDDIKKEHCDVRVGMALNKQ